MVEAAGAKVLAQPVRQAFILPQHDAFDHAAAHAGEAGDRAAGKPRMQPVGHALEPASPSDDAPLLRAQHRMDPVPAEPGALVEPMRRPARGAQLPYQSEARTEWRCAAERQLQQHRFVRTEVTPAQD